MNNLFLLLLIALPGCAHYQILSHDSYQTVAKLDDLSLANQWTIQVVPGAKQHWKLWVDDEPALVMIETSTDGWLHLSADGKPGIAYATPTIPQDVERVHAEALVPVHYLVIRNYSDDKTFVRISAHLEPL